MLSPPRIVIWLLQQPADPSIVICFMACRSFRLNTTDEMVHSTDVVSWIGATKRLGDILRRFAPPCRTKNHHVGISSARLPPQRLPPRCRPRLRTRSQT